MSAITPGVRPPAVAGRFYPGDRAALRAVLDRVLADAPAWGGTTPEALVAPHAGYVYSGPVAATGYATVLGAAGTIERVVLLGPAHFVSGAGLALSSADAFATPLGPVEVDRDLRDRVAGLPGVTIHDAAHAPEHSLEVHLPFLQHVLDGFRILPVVVGRTPPDTVAALLDQVWGGPETLVVVSSDLSHYLDHAGATARDRATAGAIVACRRDAIGVEDACGAHPLRGLLTVAARRGLSVEVLDLRNSGDTAGPRDRVVGYGAFAFLPHERPATTSR